MEKRYTKPVDLFGRELKVNDIVAFGDTTSSYNSVICVGQIVNIRQIPNGKQTHVFVKVKENGGWRKILGEIVVKFVFPRYYNNLLIIS